MAVLTSALKQSGLEDLEIQAVIFALWTVLCTRAPMNIYTLSGLLPAELDGITLPQLLPLLSPILHYSGDTVTVFHESFRTFIFHPQHSGDYHCDIQLHNHVLASRCLEIMQQRLRFNICGREISYALDVDIPGLLDQADQIISPELLHACSYWGYYVGNATSSEALLPLINEFLKIHLLHWMEVLNLKHCMREGALALVRVLNWLQECDAPVETRDFVQDAYQFVMSFAYSPASESTPQIYISALPTWPTRSPVSQRYWESTWEILQSAGFSMSGEDPALLLTWSTGSAVLSMSASLDGTRLLSNSTFIRQPAGLWDSDTGISVDLPGFTDHQGLTMDLTHSVAFSPNGSYIALGCRDRPVSIWDLQEGTQTLIQSLESNTGLVNSITFSPDNTRIACGLADCTVEVWGISKSKETTTNASLLHSFGSHTGSIRSVAFSPGGTFIASGSDDHSICVVDAISGRPRFSSTIEHTGSVNSVAFSPDGGSIVSGSSDCTIRIWNCSNLSGLGGRHPGGHSKLADSVRPSGPPSSVVIEGHTRSVNSVTFSPNGTRIASGSSDLAIRIWDVCNHKMVGGPLLGHTKSINSVVFTPDGTRIISGSDDQTIRVWDAEKPSLHMQFPLEGDVGRASPIVQPNEMTAPQMLQCLVDHGCVDLTPVINHHGTSSGMLYGGSFGDIWRGKLYNGTDVAIKVWRMASVTEDKTKSLKRAMREIYSWSKMNHTNIHKLLGVTLFQGRLGMVSRWMKHGNLREYIQKNQVVDRYQLCTQVASGLQYLHSRKTVHGDLKACNILVSQDGTAKLTDFDHSIMTESSLVFSDTTRVGGGTVRWMAPELVLETSVQRSKETDIYALGMTFLEIITGNVPYPQCQNDGQIVLKLLKKALPERTDHFKGSDKADQTWALLVRCWDYTPAARPTAQEVFDSLQGLNRSVAINLSDSVQERN